MLATLRRTALRVHRALLPDQAYIGWTPYLWLPYLAFFLAPLASPRTTPRETVLRLLAAAIFLVLYFRGYWTRGRETIAIAGAITALGVAFLPSGPGATVFFIYAAAFSGAAGPPRVGIRVLAAIEACVLLEAWLLDLPPRYWAGGAGIGLLVGLVNIYYVELGRKNAALRLSQDEVRRLAATAERERIARDLHDLLGQTLSVVALKSELASKLIEKDPARAAAEIRDVERISRDALGQVRAAVTGYRSGGLLAEVANARVALSAADVAFTYEGGVDGGLPPEHEAALSMALREAVTNVVRHARARTCRVEVRRGAGAVEMEVADDGRGGAARERGGLGGMRQRLAALGGSLDVQSGGGTRLVIQIPLGEGARA